MEQRESLIAHMEDLAEKAVKTGYAASKFLTPAEARSIYEHFTYRRGIVLSFNGGYDGAERNRAVFLNRDWGEYDRAGLFTALKIAYRQQDILGHRDILGALMALGIERNMIGDIVIGDGCATLVCLPELGEYIAENLTKAGRVGISVSEITLDELPIKQENLAEKINTVASLRLDAVMCAAFGLSRTKAAELIAAGRVQLDHQDCLQPAKEMKEGSLLSIRGLGRAKLLEIGGVSRKGRLYVRIGLFGR
jgi:RNA-binding protein YlmH